MLLGRYADQVIAVSNAVARHLINSGSINKAKIKVIYNGVDNEVFNPDVNTDYLFDEFKVPKDSVRVGMIGRVNAWKGQMDFLKAAAPLLEKQPKLYLFLVGGVFKGEEQRMVALKQFVAGLPHHERIIISDFRNDTPNLHNFFDVFVLPSTRPDPLPTVVLEAMATGRPVVGYQHGGITEMVEKNRNGLLARPNNPNLLGNEISKLINDPDQRQIMGNNSLIRQKEYFSLFSYIKNFSNVYRINLKG